MTTTTRTADGEHLEISKAGFGSIRIESLDRNGTPNWGLTLTAADAHEIADILTDFATDITEAATQANLAAKAEGQQHTGAENAAAADPFAGIVDTKHNDGWDAS
jgi:hypothetical protein